MLKKLTLVLSIFCIILFLGCEKDEIVVDEKSPQITANKETNDTITDEESRPLIAVSATDTLQIFVRQDGAPGMYLGDDGKVHGFYVDLEEMVMEEMGQSYNFVPYSDVGPVVHGLKAGTHHIALAAPDLADYRSIFNLTIPYEVLNFVTFVQKGNSDIAGITTEELIKSLYGKRVGVQTRGHIYQVLREFKEIELLEYPTTTKALEDLNKGLLDAVPDVKRIGVYYAKQNNWDIVPVGKPIISHKLTTAISKRFEASLMDRYNKALKALISDGRFDTLYESYFGPMGDEDRP
ncbi:MAG: transporter substrate-binding domain-containing protein [Desulfobacteraceae bacterium]|nr:transporter substrate-binding domain-containing protein [Desulfobacteraceae bacterium]